MSDVVRRMLGGAMGLMLCALGGSCSDRMPSPRQVTEMRLFALRGAMGAWFIDYGFIQTNTVTLAQPDSHGVAFLDGKDFDGGDWASGPFDGWGRRIQIGVSASDSVVELRSLGRDGKPDPGVGGDDIVARFRLSAKGAEPLSVVEPGVRPSWRGCDEVPLRPSPPGRP